MITDIDTSALAAARPSGRLEADGLSTAKAGLDTHWAQFDVVPVTTELVLVAGDLAQTERLPGHDAVHVAAALASEAAVVAPPLNLAPSLVNALACRTDSQEAGTKKTNRRTSSSVGGHSSSNSSHRASGIAT